MIFKSKSGLTFSNFTKKEVKILIINSSVSDKQCFLFFLF